MTGGRFASWHWASFSLERCTTDVQGESCCCLAARGWSLWKISLYKLTAAGLTRDRVRVSLEHHRHVRANVGAFGLGYFLSLGGLVVGFRAWTRHCRSTSSLLVWVIQLIVAGCGSILGSPIMGDTASSEIDVEHRKMCKFEPQNSTKYEVAVGIWMDYFERGLESILQRWKKELRLSKFRIRSKDSRE